MEWKEVRLGDILNFRRGHDLPHSAMKPGNIPVAGSNGVIGYHDTATPIKPILTIGRSGNVGKPYFYEEAWAHNTTLYVDDFKGNDPKFLYYLCQTMPFANFGGGSAVPTLNRNHIHPLETKIPVKVEDQRRIASILSSLDRKIELNNKINADLEEMAQAIFKNWFVDFEPFKDGKFVDSELGMIPEGWKVVTLDDLTSKFGTGLNPRKNFVLGHGNNYYVTIKNMGNNRIYLNDRCDKVDDEALAKINKRSKLQKGDLLFSGIGTIGRVAMIVDDPINWNTSESVFNMHPIDTVSSEFIYLLLLSDKFQQYVQQNAQGGVQQGIRMASLKAFQFAIPDDLNLFDNLVKPIISKVKSNDKENDALSLLRDTLLPRLMSGELEVPE
ncbi:MAG: restriction endonuclease subunit S [Prevotella sp.]|nr:restriction endonuclease subunit S [Prevotella sp.]